MKKSLLPLLLISMPILSLTCDGASATNLPTNTVTNSSEPLPTYGGSVLTNLPGIDLLMTNPGIVWAKTNLYFTPPPLSQEITAEFPLKNTSDRPITIFVTKKQADVAIDITRPTIDPSSESTLRGIITLHQQGGDKVKIITVNTDSADPSKTQDLVVHISQPVTYVIRPSRLDWSPTELNDINRIEPKVVTVSFPSNSPVSYQDVHFPKKYFTVEAQKNSPNEVKLIVTPISSLFVRSGIEIDTVDIYDHVVQNPFPVVVGAPIDPH